MTTPRFKKQTKAQEIRMRLRDKEMLKVIESRMKTQGGLKFSFTNQTCSDCGEKYNVYNYHIWRQTPCLCEDKQNFYNLFSS